MNFLITSSIILILSGEDTTNRLWGASIADAALDLFDFAATTSKQAIVVTCCYTNQPVTYPTCGNNVNCSSLCSSGKLCPSGDCNHCDSITEDVSTDELPRSAPVTQFSSNWINTCPRLCRAIKENPRFSICCFHPLCRQTFIMSTFLHGDNFMQLNFAQKIIN